MKFNAATFLGQLRGQRCSRLASVAALCFVGCQAVRIERPLEPVPEEPTYLDPSSAANLLANLRTAYREREYPAYERLFSSDYVFVFSPEDVGHPSDPTPAAWSRADELDSARHLFAANEVETVEFAWSPRALESEGTSGWRMRVDNAHLSIATRDENNVVWIYQVSGSTQVFSFRETDESLPSGKKRWVITRWEDSPTLLGRGARRPDIRETSWGRIKLQFLQP